MERVLLKNKKAFFNTILKKNKLNLKKLSKLIKIDYEIVREWKYSKRTIPKDSFLDLLKFYNDKKLRKVWLNKSKILPDKWWGQKGGKSWVKSVSKKQLKKRLQYVRSFKKEPPEVKIKFNKNFNEIFGALMGDGCLSKYKKDKKYWSYATVISGNKNLDSNYLKEIMAKLIKKQFDGIHLNVYSSKNTNDIKIIMLNKSLFNAMHNLGFPIGEKKNKLKIPKWVLNQKWNKQKYLIRGLFDTDGCIFGKKNQGYKHPYISICSYTPILLKQLYNILTDKSYDCNISGNNLVVKGDGNIKKWMADIGSNNKRNTIKYNYWLKNGVLPAYLLKGSVV